MVTEYRSLRGLCVCIVCILSVRICISGEDHGPTYTVSSVICQLGWMTLTTLFRDLRVIYGQAESSGVAPLSCVFHVDHGFQCGAGQVHWDKNPLKYSSSSNYNPRKANKTAGLSAALSHYSHWGWGEISEFWTRRETCSQRRDQGALEGGRNRVWHWMLKRYKTFMYAYCTFR